ncbi:LuxR C-terminal-related transcriptional regulator [Microbacterium sp. NPDC091313]
MTTLDSALPGLGGATPLLLPRPARAHLDALVLDNRSPRLLVVGPAGSGRTRLAEELAERLRATGHDVVFADSAAAVADADDDTVVVADDLDERDDLLLAALAARAARPRAAVIATASPRTAGSAAARIIADLERAQPPVVLGHASRADVVDACTADGLLLSPRCIDEILELSGSLSWLTAEALAAHGSDCDEEGGHPALREQLHDLVAHRLSGAAPAVRAAIEEVCLSAAAADTRRCAEEGYALGLLQRNGRPAPVVREAVRAITPVERIVGVYADLDGARSDVEMRRLLAGVHDPRLAAALLRDGDAALPRDPRRADELFRAAEEAGADAVAITVRRARAAFNGGDIDRAGTLLDATTVPPEHPAAPLATATAGAVWAARSDTAMAALVLTPDDAQAQTSPEAVARATIAAVGAGDADALARLQARPPARAVPSALVVAHELLSRGLRATLGTQPQAALGDLVRASDVYSAAAADAPTPELPAVLATTAALALGEIALAATVIDGAVAARHGGAWAQPRLQLWQAWVAVQRERPHEAETALSRARAGGLPAARERVMADAVTVALARRYADPSDLPPIWRRARESVLRARFDLYALLPLSELVLSAARLGDLDTVQPHLDDAHAALERLGAPPLWSSHLHWAGVQRCIILNRPDELVPHARALTAAAPHTRVAAVLAHAGKVWTEVLTGRIDADAIEHAALGLAGVGLAWDGARLAGNGAGRTEDRRVIGRLLACARQLHPREELQPLDAADDAEPAARGAELLSAREREVAALVVQGKTYAEIGESIFISPRTAEHHIARIRRRLGATSRSDLIAKLRLALG